MMTLNLAEETALRAVFEGRQTQADLDLTHQLWKRLCRRHEERAQFDAMAAARGRKGGK